MLEAARILELHDAVNAAGHSNAHKDPAPQSTLEELIVRQHSANFELWHEEDRARDPDAPDALIVAVKHSIDAINQRRNDLVEQIDATLFLEVQQQPQAKLHSETPGLIIDRLSILSLKLFHSREESERVDATEDHKARNKERADTLIQQRADLAGALDTLWLDVCSGERRFKLYKQLKMYNDPELNPVLYRRSSATHK